MVCEMCGLTRGVQPVGDQVCICTSTVRVVDADVHQESWTRQDVETVAQSWAEATEFAAAVGLMPTEARHPLTVVRDE